MSDDDLLESILRDTLAREAETVVPAGDGLARIRARVQRRHWQRWLRGAPLTVGAAALAVVTAVTVTLGPQPHRSPAQLEPAPPAGAGLASGVPNPPGLPALPSDTPAGAGRVMPTTVYYLGSAADGAGDRLYPERLAVAHTLGVIRAAVTAMLSRPPADPSHRSPWPTGRVLGVSRHGTEITVDLGGEVRRRAATATEVQLSLQQLVYTATEAAHQPGWAVRLRVDGREVAALWGQPVGPQPLRRADPTGVVGGALPPG